MLGVEPEATDNSKRETPSPVLRSRRWRTIVPIVIVVLGFAIAVYPFLPSIEYGLGLIDQENPYVSHLKADRGETNSDALKAVPQDNRLVIPKIGVDAEIVEGTNQDVALEKGIWHIPDTAESPEASNMVLSAHRWRYLPPSNRTFYLLDKMEVGDSVVVYWDGEEYDYTVTETKVVDPTAIEILDPTDETQLTLFTCTPLWSTKQRLVLIAKPT